MIILENQIMQKKFFVTILKLHKVTDYKMKRLDEPAGLLIHPPLWEAWRSPGLQRHVIGIRI